MVTKPRSVDSLAGVSWNRRLGASSVLLACVCTLVAVVAPSTHRARAAGETAAFLPAGPFRLADTRAADCQCTRLDAGTIRVQIGGRFGMPGTITAAAVTITTTRTAADGFVTVWPAGAARPDVSTVNMRFGADVANSAIVPVSTGGAIDVYANVVSDVIVDVTGVFIPVDTARAGRFVATPPTRLVDTRQPSSPIGTPSPGGSVDVALPGSVPADATAVSINVTSAGARRPGYFVGMPTGGRSDTSFMNVDGSGTPRAASVILPVSAAGFTIETTSGGDVIVDLLGWFTGPSGDDSDAGLFVAAGPFRALDTRGAPERIWPDGTIELTSPISGAAALVTNVTMAVADDLGYVTAYPAGTPKPPTSTVNAATRNHTVANFSISTVSTRGVAYYSDEGTDLLVDVTGYFTGAPAPASLPVPPNVRPTSRVLLVGDSTMAAIRWYGTQASLQGFDHVLSVESCRRLATPSCRGREGYVPTNTVTAIRNTPGWLDTVVVMAGYDDWWTVFPQSFDAVVAAARAKGARQIVWLTYREGVAYVAPGGVAADVAFVINNETLRTKVASGLYPDVVLADWKAYTADPANWLTSDGIHLTRTGAFGNGDYISRWIAHLEGRPCPRPWEVGGPVDAPCPNPDTHPKPSDVVVLYG